MGYCRNCRAQIKDKAVCPVCGAERLSPKKRIESLPHHADGAAALRKGLAEGKTLLLCLLGVSLLKVLLSVISCLTGGVSGTHFIAMSLISDACRLCLPVGLLLLYRESRKSGPFSTLGFRVLEAYAVLEIATTCVACFLPLGPQGGSVFSLFFWDLLLMIAEGNFASLIFFVVFAGIFAVLCSFPAMHALMFHRFAELAKSGKRFRVTGWMSVGVLALGSTSLLLVIFNNSSPLVLGVRLASAVTAWLAYDLLCKVKKHI